MIISGERESLRANCNAEIARLFESSVRMWALEGSALMTTRGYARETLLVQSEVLEWNLETAHALSSAERKRWSMKTALPAAELKLALNEAMRRRKECAGVEAIKVFECAGGPANWDAEFSNSGAVIDPSCKRAVLATKLGMQNRFDLAI
jgi:hypothetical protein